MTNNDIAIDMTDTTNRARVILVTAIAGLTIEIRTGMKVSRGSTPIDALRRFGFEGRTKKAALRFALVKVQELDPTYTPSANTLAVLS